MGHGLLARWSGEDVQRLGREHPDQPAASALQGVLRLVRQGLLPVRAGSGLPSPHRPNVAPETDCAEPPGAAARGRGGGGGRSERHLGPARTRSHAGPGRR